MYVLADIEWICNAEGYYSLTQIAASRTDENWNVTDKYSTIIRPYNEGFHDWWHIAYTGATKYDFLAADHVSTALRQFKDWLKEDDVLIWWHNESNEVFRKLTGLILHDSDNHPVKVLKSYVRSFLDGKSDSGGNAYKLAKARGIQTNEKLMHYSPNDVEVMRRLTVEIGLPQSLFEKPAKPPTQQKSNAQLYRYIYDPARGTLHNSYWCEHISHEAELVSFSTLKAPLQKRHKPCSCCRREYLQALREKNSDTIRRSHYTYIYADGAEVYHRPSCKTMLSARNIKGVARYDSIERLKLRPCRICNPSADDYIMMLSAKGCKKAKEKGKPTLPQNEIKALNRQKIAQEQRNAVMSNPQLTERQRKDILTLTQTEYAFFAARGYQSFHLCSCPKIRGLSDIRGFKHYKDAVRSGFVPCKKCKPTKKDDVELSVPISNQKRNDERIEDILQLCSREGYHFELSKQACIIQTAVGKWRIELHTAPVRLHHINLVTTPNGDTYHRQPRIFLSYHDVFSYIKRHDENLAMQKKEGDIELKLLQIRV